MNFIQPNDFNFLIYQTHITIKRKSNWQKDKKYSMIYSTLINAEEMMDWQREDEIKSMKMHRPYWKQRP